MGSRIGAGTYLLLMSLAINGWCSALIGLYYYGLVPGALSPSFVSFAIWALGTPVGYLFFYLSRRRLQDLDIPGKWAWVLALLFLAVILLPLLCFLPSPRYANRFGDSPGASGFIKVAAALLSLAIALALVSTVIRLYVPLHLPGPF